MKKLPTLRQIKTNECSCSQCQEMCNRPCWPTPHEARKLIKAGHAGRMMLDYWVGGFPGRTRSDEPLGITYVVAPAHIGHEGLGAPSWPWMARPCTFFVEGQCQIHAMKPLEGRAASCSNRNGALNLHEYVARKWDGKAGKAVVALWKQALAIQATTVRHP